MSSMETERALRTEIDAIQDRIRTHTDGDEPSSQAAIAFLKQVLRDKEAQLADVRHRRREGYPD